MLPLGCRPGRVGPESSPARIRIHHRATHRLTVPVRTRYHLGTTSTIRHWQPEKTSHAGGGLTGYRDWGTWHLPEGTRLWRRDPGPGPLHSVSSNLNPTAGEAVRARTSS
jgi:hypothetical protein